MYQILFTSSLSLLLCYTLLFFITQVGGTTITMINKCDYTIWPGILPNAGNSGLGTTGFELTSGGSRSFDPPSGWSGRLWARTHCSFDPNTGQGSCTTGDCGSGQIECNGATASLATLAEITLGSGSGPGNQDFYDVSLVDGYNIPMIIEPNGGSGSCMVTGCTTDLNEQCPSELRSGDGGACRSACDAFDTPEYCCREAYASPSACKPSMYSQIFKSYCPRAYSYAFDDKSSTFTCTGADYTITFCPKLTSLKKSSNDVIAGFGLGEFGSGSKHHPKFFIGGGQMLPSLSTKSTIIHWQKTLTSICFTILVLFICR